MDGFEISRPSLLRTHWSEGRNTPVVLSGSLVAPSDSPLHPSPSLPDWLIDTQDSFPANSYHRRKEPVLSACCYAGTGSVYVYCTLQENVYSTLLG